MMKTDAQLQADVIAELQWEPAVSGGLIPQRIGDDARI